MNLNYIPKQPCPNKTQLSVVILSIVLVFFVPNKFNSSYVSAENTTGEEWRVPSRKSKKTNPIAVDEKNLSIGNKLYHQECSECHGEKGKGDGPEAENLEKAVTDLSDADVWMQSDGALYFKISVGRRPMPGFKKLLSKDERWHLVNYLRSTFGDGKSN